MWDDPYMPVTFVCCVCAHRLIFCPVSGPSLLTMMGRLIQQNRPNLYCFRCILRSTLLSCVRACAHVYVCAHTRTKKASSWQMWEWVLNLDGFCLRELFDIKTCHADLTCVLSYMQHELLNYYSAESLSEPYFINKVTELNNIANKTLSYNVACFTCQSTASSFFLKHKKM